jgi:hypothetical protein
MKKALALMTPAGRGPEERHAPGSTRRSTGSGADLGATLASEQHAVHGDHAYCDDNTDRRDRPLGGSASSWSAAMTSTVKGTRATRSVCKRKGEAVIRSC